MEIKKIRVKMDGGTRVVDSVCFNENKTIAMSKFDLYRILVYIHCNAKIIGIFVFPNGI